MRQASWRRLPAAPGSRRARLPLWRRIGRLSVRHQASVDALRDVVLNPVRIPPFLGVDLDAIELHGEVDVIAAGHARHAALAHYLAALHHVALVQVEVAHVAVNSLQSVTVI